MFRYIHLFLFCLFVSTGPLLNEDMSVGCMPFKQYKDLTFSLSGKEYSWRLYTHLFINQSSLLVDFMGYRPRLSEGAWKNLGPDRI